MGQRLNLKIFIENEHIASAWHNYGAHTIDALKEALSAAESLRGASRSAFAKQPMLLAYIALSASGVANLCYEKDMELLCKRYPTLTFDMYHAEKSPAIHFCDELLIECDKAQDVYVRINLNQTDVSIEFAALEEDVTVLPEETCEDLTGRLPSGMDISNMTIDEAYVYFAEISAMIDSGICAYELNNTINRIII